MQRARRCWKLLTDSKRCVLNSRHFTTCVKRTSSGLYSAICHEPTLNTGTFATQRRPLPVILQCSSLKQDSKLRRIRGKVPDEIWAIVIFGKIRVCLAQVSLDDSADFPCKKLTVKLLSSLEKIYPTLPPQKFFRFENFPPTFTHL